MRQSTQDRFLNCRGHDFVRTLIASDFASFAGIKMVLAFAAFHHFDAFFGLLNYKTLGNGFVRFQGHTKNKVTRVYRIALLVSSYRPVERSGLFFGNYGRHFVALALNVLL